MSNKASQASRYSLIGRRQKTFEAYLNGPHGARFYDANFLSGLCQRRIETNLKVQRLGGLSIISTSLLAFFNILPTNLKLFGIEIEITESLIPILTFFVCSAFYAFTLAVIDDVIMAGYIRKIGANIKIWHFELYLLNNMAINLWSDVIVPDFFGEKSKTKQKYVTSFLLVLTFFIMFIIMLYPLLFSLINIYYIYVNPNTGLASYIVVSIGLLLLIASIFMMILMLVKFEYDPADFSETDATPTPDFQERISAELTPNEPD